MNIQEIKETVQSSHINFFIGAGLSAPFLPLLGDIETRLSNETKKTERIKIKKEYFEKVMIPNLDVVSGQIDATSKFGIITFSKYSFFFFFGKHFAFTLGP